MLIRRAARFLDPATIWQRLEAQISGPEASELVEYHLGSYGTSSLYMGIVRATGERALWMKTTNPQPSMPINRPAALWVKKIVCSEHTLLTVVLTEPEEQAAFTDFARGMLADLERAAGEECATSLLVARLCQWQPQACLPLAA